MDTIEPGISGTQLVSLFGTRSAPFQLKNSALEALALIVRGADTGMPELAPQSAGLLVISPGLSALHVDDHQMLAEGMDVNDALYAWLKPARAEVHNVALSAKT